ncbi:MAG: S1/P1 nuclease [Candidatus Cryptobacteroides sp.]
MTIVHNITRTARLMVIICAVAMLHRFDSFAWGWEHRGITYMAEKHLSDKTKEEIYKYLQESIVYYSGWLDDVRREKIPEYEQTRWWHMLSVDENGDVSSKPLRFNGDGYALGQLENAIQILSDYKSCSDSTVSVNLKYVIHILVDMHAPSHIYYSDLPGGIDARPRHYNFFMINFCGNDVTYHSIWDSPLKKLHPDWEEQDFCEHLDILEPSEIQSICEGTVADWAQDCADRCKIIYDWAKPEDHLDENFLSVHSDLAIQQYQRAAYRLAKLLNQLFDPYHLL